MDVAALINTGVLVCRFDPHIPEKQRVATDLLRYAIVEGTWLQSRQ